MKMKQLEERTGLGREAIRYYIRQGLLPEPEKPGPNVANYSEDHVERIGLIRKLKDERFLPLGVIKTILDNPALEQGNIPNLVGLEFLLAARLGITGSEDQTIEALVASTSLELHELEDLANEGLVDIIETSDGRGLSGQDAQIARIWGQIKDAGFDPVEGYDAHDMRRYADAADTLADEEVKFFYERTSSTRTTDEAAALAERGIALVEQMFSILHAKAILTRITERSAGETRTP